MMRGSNARAERYRAVVNLRSARDPARLLRGEKRDSASLDDAVRWLAIYGELLEFNRKLIDGIQRRLDSRTPSVNPGEAADLKLVRAHLQRLERRHRFWEKRRIELLSLSGWPPQPPKTR